MHPYNLQPSRAFWSKSVSMSFESSDLITAEKPVIARGDKVASAGSCFASNIIPYLERSGIEYIRTESPYPEFCGFDVENFGYSNFSAAYGNIYTARQLHQLILRAQGKFKPVDDRWHIAGRIIDPFRPGLKYGSRSDAEFDVLQIQHFKATIAAFEKANVFVFTLGLTEAWISKLDGAVFPACPGTVNGIFDPAKHEFKNFAASEIVEDIKGFVANIREINPDIRFIFTVSPVPLVATATEDHVLVASIYSKSVLRVAAQEAIRQIDDAFYFPAYEIVTGPQAPKHFFGEDCRNVTEFAVAEVMKSLLANCDVGLSAQNFPSVVKESPGATLSALVIKAECEEGALDRTSE